MLSRPLVSAALALASLALAAAPASASHQGTPDRDCANFPNQAAAQDYYEQHGGPSQDPDQLDGDNDGQACDSRPCPCRGPGGYTPTPPPPPTYTPPPAPGPAPPPQDVLLDAVVVRVIDGDTIVVSTIYGAARVRLLGIDTPQRGECGSRKATSAMRRIARVGEAVRLLTDSTQDTHDRYQRLLAYVFGDDQKLMQRQILETGWAKVYVFEDAFKRLGSFRVSQRRASRRKRGVFRRCGGRVHRP